MATLADILNPERVHITRDGLDKRGALRVLAELLARGATVTEERLRTVLEEREALQSTGLGEGVAIPHGAVAELDAQRAALLLVPEGLAFDAIDGDHVNVLVAVVGPRTASGEHLKTLARISRVLRSKALRERLLCADSSAAAYATLVEDDAR